MTPNRLLLLIVALACTAGGGWFAGRHLPNPHGPAASGNAERRVRFYQSPMHPWIQSDQPGTCTICGMQLVPVYEGESGAPTEDHLITLPPGSVTVTGVATLPVSRGDLRRTLRLAGRIEDDDSRHRLLPAYVGGRIEELTVPSVGTEVRAGEILATLYSPDLLAAAREYAAFHNTPGGPATASASDPLIRATVLRLRQYGLQADQIEELKNRPDPDRLTLPLRAPVGGTVVRRLAYPGQWVREGEPLFEIADLDTVWFQGDAYEPDLAWIREGLPVEITTPSLPGRVFTNRIAFIDPNLDPMTRSTRVRVELPNPASETPAGPRRPIPHRAFAEARVGVTVTNVLRVPRSAVLSPDGRPVAWVEVGPGAYERRAVRLGRRGDADWEVLDGLEPGDHVVTRGGLLIDAQAQLQGGPAGGHAHGATPLAGTTSAGGADPVSLPTHPLPESAGPAIDAFLRAVDPMRAALASDDLDAFRRSRTAVAEGAAGVRAALAPDPDWTAAWQAVVAASDLPDAAGLTAARAAFHRLTEPLMPLLLELRRTGATPASLRVYQCPMTRKAFPGAPPKASWFQLAGDLANPWYGAAMIDCGTEIKP